MNSLANLHNTVTSSGNVLRGQVEVSGREYTIESDGETWVNIIDDKACCETCVIDGSDVVAEGGEYVTGDWTDADWKQFSAFVLSPECEECEGSGWISRLCGACNGSGEGMRDGSSCLYCHGSGKTKTHCECSISDDDLTTIAID